MICSLIEVAVSKTLTGYKNFSHDFFEEGVRGIRNFCTDIFKPKPWIKRLKKNNSFLFLHKSKAIHESTFIIMFSHHMFVC
jgi:hypothetical protein